MYYRFSVSSYEDPALENEVALALDARSALSMRKRGDVDIPTSVLIRLADFYSVSVDYLLGRTSDSNVNF